MPSCINCGVSVGCECKLTNGLCATCAAKQNENPSTVNQTIEIKVTKQDEEDVYRLQTIKQEG